MDKPKPEDPQGTARPAFKHADPPLSGEARRQERLREQAETGTWTMRPDEIEARKDWGQRIVDGLRKLDPDNLPETP